MVETAREQYRRDGWWRDGTFLDDLKRHAAATPGKPAIITRRTPDAETQTISYADIVAATDRFSHALLALDVKPGEFVGIHLPDYWEMLPLALAAIQIGARISPLMPSFRRRELELAARITEMRVFITVPDLDGHRPVDTMLDIASRVPSLEHIVVMGAERPEGTLSFDEHVLAHGQGDPAAFAGRELPADDPYLILFTSGTTGVPKGALHSQNTLYAGIRGYQTTLGFDDSLVKASPHTKMHYVGLVQNLLTPLAVGGTAVMPGVWEPSLHLDMFERHGVTFLYAGPAWVADLLHAQQARTRDISSLRYIVSGSSAVPPSLVHEVRDTFGVRLYSLWGMTENGPVTMSREEDPPDWPAQSDGRPTGGMQVRIDPVQGRSDGSGALWVRGPAQCLGYYKNDEAYAADLDADGWFHTGDLARDDGRGGIRITGRTKDIIIRHSFLVPVLDVENVLLTHPKVAQIALIGVPDEELGERVCAVVVPTGEAPTLPELTGFLRDEGVNEMYLPERLEVVESMPRTATGKIRKVELRERFGAGTDPGVQAEPG
ncbi:MAG TPA: AMP-binding protein [Streptosporangiaceae bacterium]|nr:AMP-binding protein [Streptosporangiaceae bacterium]